MHALGLPSSADASVCALVFYLASFRKLVRRLGIFSLRHRHLDQLLLLSTTSSSTRPTHTHTDRRLCAKSQKAADRLRGGVVWL